MTPVFKIDAASALSKGQRSYQEDALIADFARGAEVGFVVLADGMGGHAAGDVASKIVVTEVYSELMFQRSDTVAFEANVTGCLQSAAMAANACLRDHVLRFPDTRGMGATLVASVIIGRQLYWISIGDSPLFLFRNGDLVQLNEDHSLAPQIDFMVKSGLIAPEEGARHPDRNVLTSVLFGEEIPQIDCPQKPVQLEPGDIVVTASDGLQFLSDDQIRACLQQNRHLHSAEIADVLLDEVTALQDPDLDNVSFSVVKVQNTERGRVDETGLETEHKIRCVG